MANRPTATSSIALIQKRMSNKWHRRYLELARTIAHWSKDPSTQCGAIIVADTGQVLSQGYNGFPRNISDDEELYKNRESKYERVVHAEMNAIYNASRTGVSLNNATIYVHGLPCCHECAKAIIQVGIKEVVTHESNDPRWNKSCNLATDFFKEAGINVKYLK
jgi:dCMP deaminase